ncbi:MAG: hypothetical protein C5B58_01370 [Acidobacteria bacterium]|nr:MAG: hypothetical protein C5B58_01370 [Acidobacteriota bacterium]
MEYAKAQSAGLDPAPAKPGSLVARAAWPAPRNWLALLVQFTSVQVGVQLVGFAAGILIVRHLPKREYAFYTIGNTMLATILLLADSGISSAISAIGGRVWQNQDGLGSLLSTALELRRQLILVTLLTVVPVLVWLLRQNGAPLFEAALLVVAVLVGASLELVTRIYAVAIRLKSEIRQIQAQALLAALAKLAVVAVGVYLMFNALVAILSVVVGYAVQFWMLRRWTKENIRLAPSDPSMHSEIVAVMRRQAPHSIYCCLQGQIAVWLISLFGNSDNVANVGALGRLAMVFSVLSSVSGDLVLPAFARIQSPGQIRRRYFHIVFGYLAISVLLILGAAIFSKEILSILGSQYSGLYREGALVAASAVVGAMAGLLWAVNAARAWIVPPHLLIPCTVALQAFLAATLHLSTVRGALLFSLYTWVPSIILSVWYAMKKMHELQRLVA